MTVAKLRRAGDSDGDLENHQSWSTAAATKSAVRGRRQASLPASLNRAFTAVGIALLLLSASPFWKTIRSSETSRRDRGPEASGKQLAQFHSVDSVRSQIPMANASLRSAPESNAAPKKHRHRPKFWRQGSARKGPILSRSGSHTSNPETEEEKGQ